MASCSFYSQVTVDIFVAENVLKFHNRSPLKFLLIEGFSSFLSQVNNSTALRKIMSAFSGMYRNADAASFKLRADRFRGFGVFNEIFRSLKPKLEPLDDILGTFDHVQEEQEYANLCTLSVLKSEGTNKKFVLPRVARLNSFVQIKYSFFFQGYS